MDKGVGILLDACIPGAGITCDWDSVIELELKEKKLCFTHGATYPFCCGSSYQMC
jgi:hypothetical protein